MFKLSFVKWILWLCHWFYLYVPQWDISRTMKTSSNGGSFRVTVLLWGESSHRSPVDSPHTDRWCGVLIFFCAWTNGLIPHSAHDDVIEMITEHFAVSLSSRFLFEVVRSPRHQGLALLTLSWDKNWDSHSLVNGYPSFYPRIALVAPSPGTQPKLIVV